MKSLEAIYEKLKKEKPYKKAVKRRIAKIILGSSVIRAYDKNTKPKLFNCLIKLDVDTLATIITEEAYDKWHARKIKTIFNCLLEMNEVTFIDNLEGLKWGHASKVFNLYIGHLYFYSPYYGKGKRKIKAHRFLHVPLDSKVFAVLKRYKIDVPSTIKEITFDQYQDIQKTLRTAARKKGVDPLRFDDYAWAGQG